MSLNVYLGIDVGSVTTKLALVNEQGKYIDSYMLKTAGKPVEAVQKGLQQIVKQAWKDLKNKRRDVSIYGATAKGQALLVKLLPHRLVMWVWTKQQGL